MLILAGTMFLITGLILDSMVIIHYKHTNTIDKSMVWISGGLDFLGILCIVIGLFS